ncbi:TM2 domain-containing protein [Novosphingobium aquae]|uniref:TM2 domain-containing protein n=1 Tax=Novosphingobium aquae TaxID=3133435 RepID=A0ABU8S3X6_9SPHN
MSISASEQAPDQAPSPSPGRLSDTQRMLIEQRVANDKPSTGVAYLLCLFLGPLGAHRFYLGATGTGIVMLILSLTFFGLIISGPWAFIDLFLIPGIISGKVDAMRQRLAFEAM